MNRREFLKIGSIAGAEAALVAVAALANTETASAQAEKTISQMPGGWTDGGVSWNLAATETLPAANPAEGVRGTFAISINEVMYFPGNWGTAKLIADMSPVGLSIFFEPTIDQPLYPIAIPQEFTNGALWQLGVGEYPEGEVTLSGLQEIALFTNEGSFQTTSLENVRKLLEATQYQGVALYVVNKELVKTPAILVIPPANWGDSTENNMFVVKPGETISPEYAPNNTRFTVSINGITFDHLYWNQVLQLVGNPSVDGATIFTEEEVLAPGIREITPPEDWGQSDSTRELTLLSNEFLPSDFTPKTEGNFTVSINGVQYADLKWAQVKALLSLSTSGATIWYAPNNEIYLPLVNNN